VSRADRSALLPQAGPALVLLLGATAVALVVAWPARPDVANAAWSPVAVVRVGGLALWGWLAGTSPTSGAPATRRDEVLRMLVAALASAPLEALAFVGSAPAASLAWSLAVAAPLGVTAYGLAWALAAALRRTRLAWLMPLASPLAVAGVLLLDLRIGPPLLLPWLLPEAPSLAAAATLALGTAIPVWLVLREARRDRA
jgi:hypothetical protein